MFRIIGSRPDFSKFVEMSSAFLLKSSDLLTFVDLIKSCNSHLFFIIVGLGVVLKNLRHDMDCEM